MNKLCDNYSVCGTTVTSFTKEIKDLSVRTTYPIVNPMDICLLSFKEKIQKREGIETKNTYVFYILNRETLTNAEVNNAGFSKYSFSATTKNGEDTTIIQTMEEIIRVSGLILVYKNENDEDVYNGVSGHALLTLCKRAGVPGDRVYKKSLWRDLYIADGLIPKKPQTDNLEECLDYARATSENIKFVVRHNAVYRGDTVKLQKMGMILGVFGEDYNETGMGIIADIYNAIKKEKNMGTVKLKSWSVSQNYTSLDIEFPEVAELYQKQYGFREKLIPGIRIISSDCGLSSLDVMGTFRVEGSDCVAVVNEYTRKHVGNYDAKEIMTNVNAQIINKFDEFPKEMGELLGEKIYDTNLDKEIDVQKYNGRLRQLIGSSIDKLGLSKSIGKKRTEALIQLIAERIGRNEDCTLYDVAKEILCLEDAIKNADFMGNLGETARYYLMRSVAQISKLRF